MLPLDQGWSLLDGLFDSSVRERARVEEWWQEHPPIGSIREPIIIAGMYRTGTTALHRMLAQLLPRHRTILGWEANIPTPPPEGDLRVRLRDRRAIEHQESVSVLFDEFPKLREFHYEPAWLPAEDVQVMAQTGLTGLWPALAACPQYVDWLLSEDAQWASEAAYRYFNDCLLTLDPDARWILKAPMHSLFLPTIQRMWPDAMIIRISRDLDSAVGSAVQFFSYLRSISKPGWESYHEFEVGSWIRAYMAEHDRRVSEFCRGGGWVMNIDGIELRRNPVHAVQPILSFARGAYAYVDS